MVIVSQRWCDVHPSLSHILLGCCSCWSWCWWWRMLQWYTLSATARDTWRLAGCTMCTAGCIRWPTRLNNEQNKSTSLITILTLAVCGLRHSTHIPRLTYFDNLKCIVSFMLKHRFTDDKKTLIVIVNTATSHISCRFCVVLASQSVQYFLSRGSDAVFSFRDRFLPCLLSYLPYYSLLFCCYSDTNRSRSSHIISQDIDEIFSQACSWNKCDLVLRHRYT